MLDTPNQEGFVMRRMIQRDEDFEPCPETRRSKLQAHIDEYLARGGKVEVLPSGIRSAAQPDVDEQLKRSREKRSRKRAGKTGVPNQMVINGIDCVSGVRAAEICGMAASSIKRPIENGKLGKPEMFQNRRWWPLEAVKAYAEERKNGK